jgi:hypothetical protein
MSPLLGVSLPYFFGKYAHDLAPNPLSGLGPHHIDPTQVYSPMLRAHELGYRAMRIWLCEGAEGILINSGVITGAHPVLVESIAIIQESAALCGLRLYWTLLDGHSARRTNDIVTRAILSEPDHTARFAELVAAPIAMRLDRRLTLAIEVINEPEALMTDNGGRDQEQWRKCGAAIKAIGDAIRSARSGTMVTAGSDHATIAMLWNSAPGLDAVGLHVKGDQALPSRADIMRELAISSAQAEAIPLIAGYRGDAAQQTHRADYNAIFRWRLEPEA